MLNDAFLVVSLVSRANKFFSFSARLTWILIFLVPLSGDKRRANRDSLRIGNMSARIELSRRSKPPLEFQKSAWSEQRVSSRRLGETSEQLEAIRADPSRSEAIRSHSQPSGAIRSRSERLEPARPGEANFALICKSELRISIWAANGGQVDSKRLARVASRNRESFLRKPRDQNSFSSSNSNSELLINVTISVEISGLNDRPASRTLMDLRMRAAGTRQVGSENPQ